MKDVKPCAYCGSRTKGHTQKEKAEAYGKMIDRQQERKAVAQSKIKSIAQDLMKMTEGK